MRSKKSAHAKHKGTKRATLWFVSALRALHAILGEPFCISCTLQVYSDLCESQVVHTSWALLALMAAGWHREDAKAIKKGVGFLMAAQRQNGDWPQQHITGVFNRNCMISYSNYRSAWSRRRFVSFQSCRG